MPFAAEVMLTETPSVRDREGAPISPRSVTVTPQFGDRTPIDAAGGAVRLPVDTCAGKGLSSVAGDAPYWSEYLVEVVYPYEKFIAQFYDENQDTLTVSNAAEISYQLRGGVPASDRAEADVEAGEVTRPAQITISKYIVNAQGKPTCIRPRTFRRTASLLSVRHCSPSWARTEPCPISMASRAIPIRS